MGNEADNRPDDELTEDELAARRAAKAGNDDDKASIADRAAEGEAETEEDDGQFAFEVMEQGRRVTMGTLIKRGVPVEYRITMGSKSLGARGGLLDPEDVNILLLVRGVVGNVDTQFTRGDDDMITKATIYVHIKPKAVVNAKSDAGRVMLQGIGEEAAAAS